MQSMPGPLRNQNGYFLIVSTLMLLALLTIISIAASNTARTEVHRRPKCEQGCKTVGWPDAPRPPPSPDNRYPT